MINRVGKTIWFTGLSGSGKSTLACLLRTYLESKGLSIVLLDGDVLRQGLNRDLGYSASDRMENIRRASEVAKIIADAGLDVVASFITPLESIRQTVRNRFMPQTFAEIYLDCPIEVCEQRDPKGLYARARRGEIPNFTGVSDPFEPPETPDLSVPTGILTVDDSLSVICDFLDACFPDMLISSELPRSGSPLPQTRISGHSV